MYGQYLLFNIEQCFILFFLKIWGLFSIHLPNNSAKEMVWFHLWVARMSSFFIFTQWLWAK